MVQRRKRTASVRPAGLGLASVRRVRASAREISAGGRNSPAVGIMFITGGQAGFGVTIHVGGIRRGGRIIAAITDVRRTADGSDGSASLAAVTPLCCRVEPRRPPFDQPPATVGVMAIRPVACTAVPNIIRGSTDQGLLSCRRHSPAGTARRQRRRTRGGGGRQHHTKRWPLCYQSCGCHQEPPPRRASPDGALQGRQRSKLKP